MNRSFFFVCRERGAALCFVLFLTCCLMLFFGAKQLFFKEEHSGTARVADAAGNDAAARHLRFLAECGWTAEGPVSVEELRVPAVFGAVYENYNRLQLAEGFDLRPYAGKTIKKYVYTVTNDPAAAKDEIVVANVLEAEGRIVGGDICTPAVDGFMHGFHGETDGYDQTG